MPRAGQARARRCRPAGARQQPRPQRRGSDGASGQKQRQVARVPRRREAAAERRRGQAPVAAGAAVGDRNCGDVTDLLQREDPRRPRLPAARHRVQGHHAAAGRRPRVRGGRRRRWRAGNEGVTKVAGIEARGFILAAPVALALGAGLRPGPQAGQAAGADLRRSPTSLSTARPRSRCIPTHLTPRRPRPDRRRRAGHRRHCRRHRRAGPAHRRDRGRYRGAAGARIPRRPGETTRSAPSGRCWPCDATYGARHFPNRPPIDLLLRRT